jgi:hypothetical protein
LLAVANKLRMVMVWIMMMMIIIKEIKAVLVTGHGGP